MDEGSIYLVVSFPENFPEGINNLMEILSSPMENSHLKIFALPDGHLLVIVENQDHVFSKFETQRIRFQSNRDRIITYIWSKVKSSLEINNIIINSNETSEIIFISDDPIRKEEHKTIDNLSSNIVKWIDWRKERFNYLKKPINSTRREKSESEQVNELLDAYRNLEDNFNGWNSGKTYLFLSLLSRLRSLLCHKLVEKNINNITYNPLLFRIASYKSLPLPIYAGPVNIEIPENILEILSENTLSHIIINEASLIKISNHQTLMDFQEWLNGEVLINYDKNNPIYYSVNKVLMESSNTGASHFDTTIPLKIDFLKNVTNLNIDLLNKLVSNTCQISLYYCKEILSQFNVKIPNL